VTPGGSGQLISFLQAIGVTPDSAVSFGAPIDQAQVGAHLVELLLGAISPALDTDCNTHPGHARTARCCPAGCRVSGSGWRSTAAATGTTRSCRALHFWSYSIPVATRCWSAASHEGVRAYAAFHPYSSLRRSPILI
jgi:hypothetical protein